MSIRTQVVLLGATDQHPERLAKLPKFLSVFCEAADSVTLVSSVCPEAFRDNVEWVRVESGQNRPRTLFGRIVRSLGTQLRLAVLLVVRSHPNQRVVSLRRYMIPALVARVMGKRPVRYHAGPSHKVGSSGLPNEISEWVANHAYSRIAVPSPGCISQFSLEGFRKKIVFGPFHVGEDFFPATPIWSGRERAVGYFGNLTYENGGYRAVDSLIEGFCKLRHRDPNLSLILGGVGPLGEELGGAAPEGVVLTGWLSHDQVRDWLDRIQLLVLPSIDEGLATILLQAMARGTPVLATPAAGNPDVIVDGETGFFMEDTSPDCIARNIQRVLEHPRLQEIAENGRDLVEQRYSFRPVAEGWRRILEDEGAEGAVQVGAGQ